MVNRRQNIHTFRKYKSHGPSNKYVFLNLPKTTLVKEKPRIQARSTTKAPKPRNSFAFALLFLFIMTFSGIIGLSVSLSSKFALLETLLTMMSSSSFSGEVNILIMGLDNVGGSHRTDTVMVIHVNPSLKKVSALSIPRDTIVKVPGIGLTKINHAFSYGGMQLTKKTLESFLNVDIPYTVKIDMGGLANIIDALGGITIDVEKRMYYVDYAGGLYIDLYPGKQVLNGKQALGYVRFRHDYTGDFGRISRQQKFVKALAQKIITHKSVLKTPRLILSLLSHVDANLNSRQILGISMSMRQAFDMGNVEMATIPGYPIMIDNVFYLRPDLGETRKLVSQMLRPSNAKGQVSDKNRLATIGADL